jgi:probable HAF family extracellular repeat protein
LAEAQSVVKDDIFNQPYTAETSTNVFLTEPGAEEKMPNMDHIIARYPATEIHAVNDKGDVVGCLAQSEQDTKKAFLYTKGSLINLGTISGGNSYPAGACAYDVNNSQEVTGAFYVAEGQTHAFRWSQGVAKDLGTLPGAAQSYGDAINNRGQVVGYARFSGGAVGAKILTVPVLWEKDSIISLGCVGDAERRCEGWAHDINDHGQIVGNTDGGAFVWQNGKMYSLLDLFNEQGHYDSITETNYIDNERVVRARGRRSNKYFFDQGIKDFSADDKYYDPHLQLPEDVATLAKKTNK